MTGLSIATDGHGPRQMGKRRAERKAVDPPKCREEFRTFQLRGRPIGMRGRLASLQGDWCIIRRRSFKQFVDRRPQEQCQLIKACRS